MFVAIRIRGTVESSKKIIDALSMLRLKNLNNCVVIPETKEYLGMLKKVKDYITWGKIDDKTLSKLLEKRCKILGDKPIDKESLKQITEFDDFDKFADALIKGEVNLKEFNQIKPYFRLNPPRHGHKALKLPYPRGSLGYRAEKINELLERMI